MDREEKYFELLLSEKSLADKMVSEYADLNLKVFGMFGVGGALLSWLFSKDAGNWSTSVGVACIAIMIASCGIMAQGVNTYALTLGYVQYRNEYLNEAFRDLLGRTEHPIQAVERWMAGAAPRPTMIANVLIGILHGVTCVALLLIAAYCFGHTWWALVALALSWCVLVATAVTEIELFRAMARVFTRAGPAKAA
jgi:hypothetical protein